MEQVSIFESGYMLRVLSGGLNPIPKNNIKLIELQNGKNNFKYVEGTK
ncbi:MAG: hypothetical protein ACOH2V_01950 [Candidatus Saccharimonadaceae bacterium]